MPTIALVDDEPMILKSLTRLFRKTDWRILPFDDPQQALDKLQDESVDLVISDYRMPQMNGVEFLKRFKDTHPDALRLVLSGQADMDGVLEAVNESEVYRFLLKPWNDDELLVTIRNALRFNEVLRENQQLADIVRRQRDRLKRQQQELERLESEMPGITRVDRTDDGLIDVSGEFDDG
ncbi:response regulator [Marinobacter halodurans]|uniref:Response regulator n=1 Tax=Marinobacter halodurans TaxID=2528979 RepID=A0ABY1ZFE4_9GAMM|nr:response regulator [Marinobacter halodurans]TBW49239.1 response regulator [Marinobacter halodurans]